MKPITIPCLELTAAIVAVRIDKMFRLELKLPLEKSYFWIDSTSVLKYIKNENRRFQTFVANRVTIIRDNSEDAQCRYIPSSLNPADDASRGTKAENLLKQRWMEGPEFLHQPEEAWPTFPVDISINADDPELKKNLLINATLVDTNATIQLMSHRDNLSAEEDK